MSHKCMIQIWARKTRDLSPDCRVASISSIVPASLVTQSRGLRILVQMTRATHARQFRPRIHPPLPPTHRFRPILIMIPAVPLCQVNSLNPRDLTWPHVTPCHPREPALAWEPNDVIASRLVSLGWPHYALIGQIDESLPQWINDSSGLNQSLV